MARSSRVHSRSESHSSAPAPSRPITIFPACGSTPAPSWSRSATPTRPCSKSARPNGTSSTPTTDALALCGSDRSTRS